MKELAGYLIDRATGLGIAGKAVAFKNLAGANFVSGASPYIALDAVTDADGKFRGRFELSPGPVNVEVTVSGTEKKVRKWDEKAEIGASWQSDLRNLARGIKEGVISGYLNEMAVSIPAGHTIRIATGGAIFNGNLFSIENGNFDLAGTANTNPALNPRLDLVTLRQYNEDAAGQDAGRQDVIVTLGVSQNVAPVTPTGATFKDLPLAVVSTAYNAATKTVATDLRVFTGNTSPVALLADSDTYNLGGLSIPLTTSYTTIITPTITGLDVRKTYDGEVNFHGILRAEDHDQNTLSLLILRINVPQMLDGAITDRYISQFTFDLKSNSEKYDLTRDVSFSWPIIGVTGVTSFPVPVEFKTNTGYTIMPQFVYGTVTLRERR